MKKSLFTVLLATCFAAAIGLCACGQKAADTSDTSTEAAAEATDEQAADEVAAEPEVDGSAYGYAGSDPVEAAVYKYMVEEVSKNFEAADVSIPVVQIVHVDYTNPDEVLESGYNYDEEQDEDTFSTFLQEVVAESEAQASRDEEE